MSEMSDRRDAMYADIELALLTDPTPAGWVYVDLEGINPRIITHTEDRETSAAYAERLLAILWALCGEVSADRSVRLRKMKFHINTAIVTGEQRRAARPALAARLGGCGCSDDEIEGHEFERRSVCKCGTGWPQVTQHPRKSSTWM
mgnify:CR=1 FL=1